MGQPTEEFPLREAAELAVEAVLDLAGDTEGAPEPGAVRHHRGASARSGPGGDEGHPPAGHNPRTMTAADAEEIYRQACRPENT